MYYDSKKKRQMKKLTIYVARYKSSVKHSGHSRPCFHCTKEIKRIGIKKIVYVDSHGEIQKCLTYKYSNDHVCHGYTEFNRQNIEVD